MRADAARNRRKVLDAAYAAFLRSGVATSLDDIARSAGVGPGTLYRHFPTRDRLVLAVIEDGLREIAALGVKLTDHPDPVAALAQWLTVYIGQAGVFDGLARSLVAPPDDDDDGKDACRASRAAGAALLARAVDTGAVRVDADIDDVLDMAAAIAWIGEQPDRDEDQRGRLVGILVDGLRP
ncbi:TetR/AcrR family transcriptional regulator [Mycolicibacterium mageritense]|uniref:TetR/AcrR family transcriptional regulator n=1 Tax=Mycolicibacterium mageritense TaxID=53462 RepID=UPI001E56448E|nr:TetR/AcrR family transcriptional regulator [Mycolicibacterium mageritense]GJJ20213.1 TetR family transcriptional regulator [Mycolicibacterium mageritense]